MEIIQDRLPLMVLGFVCLLFGATVSGETVAPEKIIRDTTIVAPGYGSDGILINEDIESVVKRVGRTRFKISRPMYPGELFDNVFKVAARKKIYFEEIYYNDESRYAACVFHGKVIAIIGFDSNKVTSDAIKLQSGINSFIFNYGNRNLNVLKNDSNRIYLYSERGIAVVDDGGNDSIDLYIIFGIDMKK